MLLGHIVCKQGLSIEPVKIVMILIFPPPKNVKMLKTMLGNIGYYHKFIRGYIAITTPMEKLLKKDVAFVWSQECQGSFNTLKDKMASEPILFFLDLNEDFHIDVDASFFALGVVLVQPGEGDLDHLITFGS